ncbi:type II toxin-antitoxin system PrlF family antitoxin [Zavarzinia sp.]|uniref:type II toxin-antitoxin system PrlF family antitoxin n=1 Tax=Zavarzinia sp. TaxID=2027920 RepID=UPI003BB6948A
MNDIREIATLTSKGQITLPKVVRQVLGVDQGGKVRFEIRSGEVVVTRAETSHEDPAIGAFLDLIERDIRAGRHIGTLPDDIAKALLAEVKVPVDPEDEIEGDVAL